MIKPQLPIEDQKETEIASGIVVDEAQLDPGSDGDMWVGHMQVRQKMAYLRGPNFVT